MLRGLFPRLFGQFREGGFIVGQFTVSNSGATLTPTANSYTGLSCAGDTGLYTLTLAGGARKIVLVSAHASMAGGTVGEARQVRANRTGGINAGAGTIPLVVVNAGSDTVAPSVADLVDGSLLTVCLYVDK